MKHITTVRTVSTNPCPSRQCADRQWERDFSRAYPKSIILVNLLDVKGLDVMNAVKTFFLMMVLTSLILLVGAALGGIEGIFIAFSFAIIMNFGAYWFSDRIASAMAHAHPVADAGEVVAS